jgi:hypothetical protein
MKKPKPKIYPSMGAASAGMSIPLPLLKRLKSANCPGFDRSGRVNEEVVSRFIEDNPELLSTDGLPAGYDPLKATQIEKILFDLEIKKGLYVLKETVKADWAEGMEIIQKVMQAYIPKQDYNKAIREMKRDLLATGV